MIHPTAIVDPDARLADDVEVGPFSVIGPGVEIAGGTTIGPHVTLRGPTRIGRDNRIFQYASVGEEPQDKKFGGEETRLEIGDRNTIREFVTLNRGTSQDRGVTSLGNDNWIMAYVHVAHDCVIGDRTVFANGSSLAGHVIVEDDVILGGFSLVHQFCHIGTHAFSAMGTTIKQDVPPFVTVAGNPAEPHGINVEGLRRQGFDAADIQALRRAYRSLYKAGLRLEQAVASMQEMAGAHPPVAELLRFIAGTQRGLVR